MKKMPELEWKITLQNNNFSLVCYQGMAQCLVMQNGKNYCMTLSEEDESVLLEHFPYTVELYGGQVICVCEDFAKAMENKGRGHYLWLWEDVRLKNPCIKVYFENKNDATLFRLRYVTENAYDTSPLTDLIS